MKREDENTTGHRAVQLSGAFAFLEGRQFDIVIVARFRPGEERLIKQIQIYYSENARVSSFVFDEYDKNFTGNRELFLAASMQAILTEIKSRTLAQDEFLVWYYTDIERDSIEKESGRFLLNHKPYQRYVDELVSRSRIIEIAEEAGPG